MIRTITTAATMITAIRVTTDTIVLTIGDITIATTVMGIIIGGIVITMIGTNG